MLNRSVRQILKKLRLREKKAELANSLDPDGMAHMSHLIWIYTVCQALFQVCSVEMVKPNGRSSRSFINWASPFPNLGLLGIISVSRYAYRALCKQKVVKNK